MHFAVLTILLKHYNNRLEGISTLLNQYRQYARYGIVCTWCSIVERTVSVSVEKYDTGYFPNVLYRLFLPML